MDNTKRICLWSGPRNISTALMYSFAQRMDTKVFDEPLYGYYLKHHPTAYKFHPGSKEIMNSMQIDGNKVVNMMLTNMDKPVLFFKHMTHHLLDLDKAFMHKTKNIILTREPKDMLISFNKVIKNPTMNDVGYAKHLELIEYFNNNNIPFVVLDSKKVLINPENTLKKLCKFIEIKFDKRMLSWSAQQRIEDGVWAKYWYKNVHKSTGFKKYTTNSTDVPSHLKDLLKDCVLHYNKLIEYSI